MPGTIWIQRIRRAFLGRLTATLAIAAALSTPAFGQQSPPAPTTERTWSSGVSAAWYMLPDESDYIQPTLKADRDWLHLETRAEYVFDLGDSSSKFFYMWSELSLRPAEWLRAGMVTQR